MDPVFYYNETCVKKCQQQLLLEAPAKKNAFFNVKIKGHPNRNFLCGG